MSNPDWIQGYEYLMDGGSKEILLNQAYSILSDYHSKLYDPRTNQADVMEMSARIVREAVGDDWVNVWMQINDYAAEHKEERRAQHEHATKIVPKPPRVNKYLPELVRLMEGISAGVREWAKNYPSGGRDVRYYGHWGWSQSMHCICVELDINGVSADAYLTDDDEDIIMEGVQSGKYVPEPPEDEEDKEEDDDEEDEEDEDEME